MNPFYNKKKKGYTLAEVLATVAILLILMAIAVPAIFSIRKNLRQKALDNKAELIYTAVQNNLVKLQSNGNSSLYDGEKRAKAMGRTPSDATKEQKLYYALSSEKTDTKRAASVLVTTDTVDGELYNNYWVVEYNPESASVYAVFYSETREDYSPIAYDDLRYKENRLSDGAQVGYYGGDTLDSSSTSTLAPVITIKNEEKLTASITCMRQDSKPLSFEVTLTDAENHSITLKYKLSVDKKCLVHDADALHLAATSIMDGNESSSVVGKKYNLNITLDDLSSADKRFAALYGNKNTILKGNALTAGTALKIKVTVKSESSRVDGKNSEVITNSLFADSSTKEQAVILYGRHLQNLDQESGVTDDITKAVQESNIHFEAQDDKEDGDTTSWYSCYKNLTFKPITNTKLLSYTGNGNTVIYHLTVDSASQFANEKTGAGLFSALNAGMTVNSVRLSGTSIKLANGNTASIGAIAGETLGDATISDCQVFLETEDVEGKDDETSWISGNGTVGGLIGQTGSTGKVVIQDSFAATVIDGGESGVAGGLIGQTNSPSEITRCYSDSYLRGKVTGGLIGYSQGNAKISSCYTAGYQETASEAGGMIASGTSNNYISNSYVAVTYNGFNADESAGVDISKINVYSVGPAIIDEDNISVYYLVKGNQGKDDGGYNQGKYIGYKELSNRLEMINKLGGDFVTSTTTHPYNLRNQGLSSYSYPSLKNLQHYGDWQASYEAGSLVYYEKYAEGASRTIGFFGGNITSTLLDNQTIVGDGYGVVYQDGEQPLKAFTVEYQNGTSEAETKTITIDPASSEHYTVIVSGTNYIIYPLPAEDMNMAALSETFYQKLTIKGEIAVGGNTDGTETQAEDILDGKTFYFNPHFAKTIEQSDTVPENPTRIAIRTVRQLYHLSLYYNDYVDCTKKSTFTQETDIDYNSNYEWEKFAKITEKISVQSPIGIQNGKLVAFEATYNGGSHEIRGISFETSMNKIGFIGENQGTVQNVILAADWNTADDVSNLYVNYDNTIERNRKVYMGVLTGINKGKIQNCAVSGYQLGKNSLIYVQRNGTAYLGGMTGSNQGTIINCEAEISSMRINALYGNAYLGGFAGENGSAGIIRNSYAIGNLAVTFARGSNSVIGGFTAYNAGVLRNDYCAVAMTAAGSTSTYGFAPKGTGIISSDCYYLNGGTFRYLGEMLAYDNDNQNGGGKGISYKELVEKTANSKATESKCHQETEEDNYPFAAVVTNSSGRVHYGNWQIPVNLGSMGVIYWELEEGGANNGYHFSYIGYTQDVKSPNDTLHMTSGSTLCQQHDDGGKISQYGYGYYYADPTISDISEPTIKEKDGFVTGTENTDASNALSSRLDGFKVVAYTTEAAIEGTAQFADCMKMTSESRQANGQWSFDYNGQSYAFTINPFFANAMQYGIDDGTLQVAGISTMSLNVVDEDGFELQADTYYPMPGTKDNRYEIRSDDQLQYLNWNYSTGNAYTMISDQNYEQQVDKYTYLGYAYKNTSLNTQYYWYQTHDVDAEMTHSESQEVSGLKFTQIGSMYDEKGGEDKEEAAVYMTYFSGNYDGNTYYIKNVEVDSKNTVVGLFGSIIGAEVQNIILYSENGNYIQRNQQSPRSWYAIGGLCGLAAVGAGKDPSAVKITNCTVSGYVIRDNSTQSSWGDGNIGGMFGMCTVDLTRCTAVNTIDLNTEFDNTKSDGVSVRAGGLVGSMRGNITSCYTGGEIKCEERCRINAGTNAPKPEGGFKTRTKLFLGGITGGIYIKNKGNLTALLGGPIKGLDDNWSKDKCGDNAKCKIATTVISNCYTYIKMPNDEETVKVAKSIEPIGSNGETPHENSFNHHVRVEVKNCYYYENNIPDSCLKQFTIGYANNNKNGSKETNIFSDAMKISWNQLSNKEAIVKNGESRTLLEWLNSNDNTEPFEQVTIKENGQDVNGKYSFPGDRSDLDGEDYPFPTVLQQKSGNGHVNVHYGAWPLEGIYWKESRATMDIYENLVVDERDAGYGKAVKDFELHESKSVLGIEKKLGTGKNDLQVEYSSGINDTDVLAFSDGGQQVVFSDTGDEEAEGFSSDADESVNTTESAAVGAADGTADSTGTTASDAADTDGTSKLLEPDEYIAEVTNIYYDSSKGCYIATVKAIKTGTTVITVKTTGTDGQPYRASFTLTVTADLTVYASPASIEQSAGQSTEVTLYAVPTAMITGTNAVEVTDANTAMVGSDGFTAENYGDISSVDSEMANEEETYADGTEGFSSAGDSVDMITDGDFASAVYAGNMQEPSKNLASLISWEVKTAEETEGAVTTTQVADSRFKVTSEAEIPVTLTISGTFEYEGITYTSMTWVEVTTPEAKEIKWENQKEELMLKSAGTSAAGVMATTKQFNLIVPEDCISNDALTVDNFTVTPVSATDTQTYADEETMEMAVTDPIAEVKTVIAPENGSTVYKVEIQGNKAGIVKVTVNVTGKDGATNYTASLILTVKAPTVTGQMSGTTEGTNPANDGWGETDDMNSGFNQNETDGWQDNASDYVDIVPNESYDNSADDNSGWGSGE